MALVIAAGCVLNNCIDRNMDRKMFRTRNRILARGLMRPAKAVSYGSLLAIAGMTLLWTATNPLCVAVVLGGILIYVGVYSLYLKRRSMYGMLIGSLAGAAPPLAGYCAAGNRFDAGAAILLCIFCLWQITHSYAIAIYRYTDYAAASIPVLPVMRGLPTAKRHILVYMTAFVGATLLLTFGGYTGYRYLGAAVGIGMAWMVLAWAGYRASDNRIWAKKMFISSIVTITVLSIMMTIDFTEKKGVRPPFYSGQRVSSHDHQQCQGIITGLFE
jgi:protoheme IX farnesyltransferase